MFTPRPRESEGASSPSGRDVEYEKLPPSAIPARLDSTKKMELEAEMVAVQEKILNEDTEATTTISHTSTSKAKEVSKEAEQRELREAKARVRRIEKLVSLLIY